MCAWLRREVLPLIITIRLWETGHENSDEKKPQKTHIDPWLLIELPELVLKRGGNVKSLLGAATVLSLSEVCPIALPNTLVYKHAETLNSPSKGMGKAAACWKMQGIWKECPDTVMCPSDQLADCILFSHSFIPSRHPWLLFQPWVVMTSSFGTTTGEGERQPSQAAGTIPCFYWPEGMMDEQQMLLSASLCTRPAEIIDTQ